MSRLVLFNKPFGVICQFSADGMHPALKSLIFLPSVYPAGRLDTDSEGVVVLTDDGKLQAQIADPRHKLVKTYWAQVEGIPSEAALDGLRRGIDLGDQGTRPAQARVIEEPREIWLRDPPIRYRKAISTRLTPRHHTSRDPGDVEQTRWIPACAGMTTWHGSSVINFVILNKP